MPHEVETQAASHLRPYAMSLGRNGHVVVNTTDSSASLFSSVPFFCYVLEFTRQFKGIYRFLLCFD